MLEKLTKKRNNNIDPNEIVDLKLLTELIKDEKVAVVYQGEHLSAKAVKSMLQNASGYKIDAYSMITFFKTGILNLDGLKSIIDIFNQEGEEICSLLIETLGEFYEEDIINYYKLFDMQISSKDLANLRYASNFGSFVLGRKFYFSASHIIKINNKDHVWVLKTGANKQEEQGFGSLNELLKCAEKLATEKLDAAPRISYSKN